MATESNGSSKLLLKILLPVVGALLLILWGIAWGSISDNTRRVEALENTRAAQTVVLEEINRRLGNIEGLLRKP